MLGIALRDPLRTIGHSRHHLVLISTPLIPPWRTAPVQLLAFALSFVDSVNELRYR